ncbi:cytochrome P450 [Streptomyces graminilatus]|uniref:cytochrome P450 n=1 Tax=Streptomyces graminilatus TaxID=1464070 RepID=UPI0006E1C4A9|nr:cytochrome P450 [Streptomyces graminilatus]
MPSPATASVHDITVPDLTDPTLHAERDLSGYFRRLRAEQPVVWCRPPGKRGFWLVSTYAEALTVCRDGDSFVSTGGNVMDTLLTGGDAGAGRMLAVMDGPRHTSMRKLLWRSFTPGALTSYAERIRSATLELLRAAVRTGTCDFASDVAATIPLVAICDLLGVPAKDRQFILERTSNALGSEGAAHAPGAARLAKGELLLYFAKLARARRKEPADDLITLLSSGLVEGDRLTDDEVMLNCYSLILGGDETTRLTMIGGVRALIDHPEQWRALKDGTVTTASATEEILRWTSPALHIGRTAVRDLDLGGERIRAGDAVVAWTASANFDEAEFDEPDRFDLARQPNRHLSFAYGPHYCLGVHLARIEIGALLDGLRETVSVLEPAGPTERVHSNFLSGLSSLPLRLRA